MPLVAPEALLPALSPPSVSSPPYAHDARAAFYGFGVGVSLTSGGRVQFSHSGAFTLDAATNYVLLPSEDVGIVVLGNAAPVGAVEVIRQSLMDLVQFGKIIGTGTRPSNHWRLRSGVPSGSSPQLAAPSLGRLHIVFDAGGTKTHRRARAHPCGSAWDKLGPKPSP